jgi:ATP-dependent protease ClpP protease subunit
MEPMMPFGPVYVNEFTEKSAMEFRLSLLNREMEGNKPIVVMIDSFGGCAYAVLAMIDAIESCNNTVVTVATGKAMSCGAILLACGDTRFITPRTRVMIHEVTAGHDGNINETITIVQKRPSL